ncbi:unnamed protein product [Albugo candida]|uniref:Uncharacterized protein n=1 Tax=Albugo candida TaxID=65357 RepID=A0A024GPG0_9STRA|nr:unnamed protein product [Albugo candida]|eukprot:CCI48242.1 unnamed protein product [Albugo candida]
MALSYTLREGTNILSSMSDALITCFDIKKVFIRVCMISRVASRRVEQRSLCILWDAVNALLELSSYESRKVFMNKMGIIRRLAFVAVLRYTRYKFSGSDSWTSVLVALYLKSINQAHIIGIFAACVVTVVKRGISRPSFRETCWPNCSVSHLKAISVCTISLRPYIVRLLWYSVMRFYQARCSRLHDILTTFFGPCYSYELLGSHVARNHRLCGYLAHLVNTRSFFHLCHRLLWTEASACTWR